MINSPRKYSSNKLGFSSMICFNLEYILSKNQNCNAIFVCNKTGRKSKVISFLCVHRSSPCLPSNKRYGVTTTLMSLSHENVYEREKVAISFFNFSSRGHDYLHVHRRWIELLSTKKKHWIVQINDRSMKLCHNTYDPKTNIFWYRANPN